MVSMKDIAGSCNVSIATVSKALNNHNDIGEETRKRIKQTAASMGYYPNSAARALKTNRSYNIGVLLNDEAHSGLTHEYFSAVLEGARVKAESLGYDITFINTHNSKMTYYEHCKYRNLDGVILACTDFENPEVVELVDSSIPTVTIDYIFNNCASVISNNVKGMSDLVRYVHSKGHTKIAYIHGQKQKVVTRDRLAAYYNTLEELGVEINDDYVIGSSYLSPVQAEEATYKLLKLKDPPTCILYPDDFSLTGGSNALRQRNLQIPQDMSIAGYDGIKLSQMLTPKITTVRQDTDRIGKEAAQALIRAIEKPKTTFTSRVLVEGDILSGESVGNI